MRMYLNKTGSYAIENPSWLDKSREVSLFERTDASLSKKKAFTVGVKALKYALEVGCYFSQTLLDRSASGKCRWASISTRITPLYGTSS